QDRPSCRSRSHQPAQVPRGRSGWQHLRGRVSTDPYTDEAREQARAEFAAAVDVIARFADPDRTDPSGLASGDVCRLLVAGARLYTAKDEFGEIDEPMAERDITATEAVTAAAALMHAQHL